MKMIKKDKSLDFEEFKFLANNSWEGFRDDWNPPQQQHEWAYLDLGASLLVAKVRQVVIS